MRDREFEKLLEGVQQAGQIRKGRMKPSRVTKFIAPDIKAIRRDMELG